ncbi:MAG: alkaline phosphatase [Gemmatimonadota bacterium]
MDRREWLRRGGLAGLGVAGLGASGWSPRELGAAHGSPLGKALEGGTSAHGIPRAQRVIFFAYDGLGWEDIGLARYWSLHNRDRVLELERLLATGASGAMLTHSLTSVVTDSAAASSAWSTGRKIVNQAVSQYPDGTDLTPILHLAQARGMATGLVTTARITHATPAGWWAQIRHRDLEDDIALQYLESGLDVLLGGGEEHFLPGDRADGRDLFPAFRSRGYQVLRSREALARATGDRLLGVFSRGHVAYEIDRLFQGAPDPSLAELTRKGLEVMDGRDTGFVLQVEAGRVDHANHENDPGGCLHDILAADEALKVVLDYADRTPGTLVIVASDHATGGGVVFGRGSGYRRTTEALQEVARQKASYGWFRRALGSEVTADAVRMTAADLLGVELSEEDAERLVRVHLSEERMGHRWAHTSQPLNSVHQAVSQASVVGPRAPATPRQALAPGTSGTGLRLNVNYASSTHTSGPVPVALYGAGISSSGLGVVDNTQLFEVMLRALGISFQNPMLSEEGALEALETASLAGDDDEAERPHWA